VNADLVARLRAQCGGPRDGALLRFSLGRALFDAGEPLLAIAELQRALALDADHSAAWKVLGQASAAAGDPAAAGVAFARGIEVATRRGEVQAVREMQVFQRRLQR
jgi:predicted Zn-dependent protease